MFHPPLSAPRMHPYQRRCWPFHAIGIRFLSAAPPEFFRVHDLLCGGGRGGALAAEVVGSRACWSVTGPNRWRCAAPGCRWTTATATSGCSSRICWRLWGPAHRGAQDQFERILRPPHGAAKQQIERGTAANAGDGPDQHEIRKGDREDRYRFSFLEGCAAPELLASGRRPCGARL